MPRLRPKNVHKETTRHGKVAFYFRRDNGPRIRLPDISSPDFYMHVEAAAAGRPIPYLPIMPKTSIELRKQRVEKSLRNSLVAARSRSISKNLPFNLNIGWLLNEAEKQQFKCKLTGIEFFAKPISRRKIDPYSPSLDRIEPEKGYVTTNVRIVIRAVNTMLLDWGTELFEQVANSYRYHQRNEKRKSIPALCNTKSRTLKKI